MKFSIRTIIWGSVLLAMLLAGAFALIPKPVDVEYAVVAEGPLRVSVQEDGKTRIREKYIVSAPVSGRLSRIELRSGDEICCDKSLLAVILPSDPDLLDARSRAEADARVLAAQASVNRSDSTLKQSKINYDLSKTKFDRAEGLLLDDAISKDEYDRAKAEFRVSEQAIKTAEFDAEIAKFELEMARAAANQFSAKPDDTNSLKPFEVFAPISGKVLRVFQESSTVVAVGTPLIELGDPKNLEIEIDVLSTDAVRIKPGAEMSIEHWGGQSPLKGYVRVIEPAAFTKVSSLGVEEQRVNIIADFNESLERISALGDGYRVEARITIEQISNVLLVPNSALFRHQREWHVFKIENGKAVMQKITIGLQNESMTQVAKGLQQGDQVVIYPNDNIATGTKIRLVNDQPKTASDKNK